MLQFDSSDYEVHEALELLSKGIWKEQLASSHPYINGIIGLANYFKKNPNDRNTITNGFGYDPIMICDDIISSARPTGSINDHRMNTKSSPTTTHSTTSISSDNQQIINGLLQDAQTHYDNALKLENPGFQGDFFVPEIVAPQIRGFYLWAYHAYLEVLILDPSNPIARDRNSIISTKLGINDPLAILVEFQTLLRKVPQMQDKLRPFINRVDYLVTYLRQQS